MFKRAMRNKSINVKLVDDQGVPSGDDMGSDQNPWLNVEIAEAYAEIAKDVVTHVAFTIGGVFAVCKIVERICK